MRTFIEKIQDIRSFVQADKETGNLYYSMDKRHEELRELYYFNRDEVIDIHDQYVLQYLDEAFDVILYNMDEEIYNTIYIETFNVEVQADPYISSVSEWLASNHKRIFWYGDRAYKEGEYREFLDLLNRAQEMEKEDLVKVAKDMIIKYLELN